MSILPNSILMAWTFGHQEVIACGVRMLVCLGRGTREHIARVEGVLTQVDKVCRDTLPEASPAVFVSLSACSGPLFERMASRRTASERQNSQDNGLFAGG